MPVVWRSLELEGFGRYRDGVRVEFDSGLNAIVAENEAGKSTLVAGLSSVLFGLPRSSAAGGFGAARFLNWDQPGRFSGAVEFDAAGERHRIRRDFEDNRVWLETRQESGEWLVRVQGEHNPQAHKRNERYEEAISSLFGVASRELFWKTFCVMQPLPDAKKLDHSVQRLLSGSGGDLKASLQALFDRLRDITKNNTEFGAGSDDGRLNRPLDEERERVDLLENTIRAGSVTLDRLYAEDAGLAQAEDRKRQIQSSLQQKEAALSAFAEWRRLRDLYAAEVRQKSEIEKALASVEERRKSHEALIHEIDRRYRPFIDAEVGERLGELSNLEARLSERDAQVADIQGKIESLEAERGSLQARLREEFGDVRGRQYLVVQVRALQQISHELADLRRRASACAAEIQETQGALAALPDWDSLGENPAQTLSYIRAQAGDFRRAWEKLAAMAASLDAARLRIQQEHLLFETADPAARDALSRYDTRLERLEREVITRQTELSRAQGLVDARAAEEARLTRDFSDIAGLDDAFIEAADKKVRLLRESYEHLRDAETERAQTGVHEPISPARRAAAMLLFGITGFVLVWSVLGSPSSGPALIVSTAVGIIGAVLGWSIGAALSLPGRRERGRADAGDRGVHARQRRFPAPDRSAAARGVHPERLARIQREILELAPALGDFASADQARLAVLLERINTRDARRVELEAARRAAPQSHDIRALEEELESARKDLDQFRDLTRPFADAFHNVAEAFSAWRAAKAEERNLTAQFGEALAEMAPGACCAEGSETDSATRGAPPGAPATGVPRVAGTLGTWLAGLRLDAVTAPEGILALARLAGSEPSTAGELALWLSGRDDSWWEEMTTGAARFEELTSRASTLSRAAQDLSGQEKRLDAQAQGLARDVKPFDAATDLDTLDALWNAARDAERQEERVLAALEALLQRLEPLGKERQKLQDTAEGLRSRLRDALDAGRRSTAQAAELWAQCQALVMRAREIAGEIEGILRGQQVSTIDALRQRATDTQMRALFALNKWQSYTDGYPGLPPAEMAFDIEAVAALQEHGQREVLDLRAALSKASEEVDEQNRRVAEMKAAQVPNIAALAEELEEHRRILSELEMDAKSLGIAYAELDAARRDYQAKYRDLLSDRATARFRELSGALSRRVQFDEGFETVVTEDGRPVALEQLSQGARDQLYLAMRLALADLLAGDVELPLIFDDPFLTCDEHRTERIRAALLTIASSRQVIVLSHRGEVASWGRRAEVSRKTPA